jgi:hypothetical protein
MAERAKHEKRKLEVAAPRRGSLKIADKVAAEKSPLQLARKADCDLHELDSSTRIAAIALMIEPLENELQQVKTELRRKNYEIDFLSTELERERLEKEEICLRASNSYPKRSEETEQSTVLPILLDQALLSSRQAAQEDLEWINRNHSLKLEKMENDSKRLRSEAADKDLKISSLTSQLTQALDMLDKSLRQQTAHLLRPPRAVAYTHSPEPHSALTHSNHQLLRTQPPPGAASPPQRLATPEPGPYTSGSNAGSWSIGEYRSYPGEYWSRNGGEYWSRNGGEYWSDNGCPHCGSTRGATADAQTQSDPPPPSPAAAAAGRLKRDVDRLLRSADGLRTAMVPRGRLCAAEAAIAGCKRAARREAALRDAADAVAAAAAAAVREEAAAALSELAGCRREVKRAKRMLLSLSVCLFVYLCLVPWAFRSLS